jgi:glycosyltransferase involved in cell wall biosynthesis
VNPVIVHVASGREWRGGQRQVWLLAGELARLGVEQVVVTGRETELANRLKARGVLVHPARWDAGLDPRVIWPILQELRRRPAVLHAHDAHALALAGICSTLTKAPLVATRRVDFHVHRRGYWTRADRVIAISQAVADVLLSDGIRQDRITVVHSGISLDLTRRTARLGIRDRLGLSREARIAANVAALVPHKDHANLIDAAKILERRFPDLHWVVAGQGRLRDQLATQIVRLGLGERVHLIGHVDEPARLTADADLFVMSSREEGLGTSVLEAMALGIPIASTSAGGLPELLGQGAGLLVPPRDPAALAEAVARILDDAELSQRLVGRGQEEVLRFSDRRMAEEVRSVYRSFAHSLDGS